MYPIMYNAYCIVSSTVHRNPSSWRKWLHLKKKLISLPNVQGMDTIEYNVMYIVLVIALYIKTDTLFKTCKNTIFFYTNMV